MWQIDRWRHRLNNFELHALNNIHVKYVRIIVTKVQDKFKLFFLNFMIFKVPPKSL